MKKINDYIGVKEASDLVQKSQASIRRICKKNENTPFVKKESGKYWLSKAFILEEFSMTDLVEKEPKEDDFPYDQEQKTKKNIYIEELSKERDLFEQINENLTKKSQEQAKEIEFLQTQLVSRTNEAKDSLKSLNANKEDELTQLQRRLEEQEKILSSVEKQKKSLQNSLAEKDSLLKELQEKIVTQKSKPKPPATEIKIDLSKILFIFLGVAVFLVFI